MADHTGNTDPGYFGDIEETNTTERSPPSPAAPPWTPRLVTHERRGVGAAWAVLEPVHKILLAVLSIAALGAGAARAWDRVVASKADRTDVLKAEAQHHQIHERQDAAIGEIRTDAAVTRTRVEMIGQDVRRLADRAGIPAPTAQPSPRGTP